MQKQIKTASLCHLVNDVIGSMEPPSPFNKKTWKNKIKFMVYGFYEYPFTDKFGCCSLYDREGAVETKANTKQIFYTII